MDGLILAPPMEEAKGDIYTAMAEAQKATFVSRLSKCMDAWLEKRAEGTDRKAVA